MKLKKVFTSSHLQSRYRWHSKMQIQNCKAGNAIFTIVDMAGKKVLVKYFKNNSGNQLLQIDLGQIAKGKYFVQYINVGEKIVTSFFKN